MHPISTRHPQVATCEDYDEDARTVLKGTGRKANIGRKLSFDSDESVPAKSRDGSDASYSSKAGLTDTSSMSSPRKHPVSLRVETQNDRKPQPYSMTPAKAEVARKPVISAKPRVKIETPKKEKKSEKRAEPVVHVPRGTCWVCDVYGRHIDPPPQAGPPTPTSPNATRKSSKQSPREAEPRVTTSRRRSSVHQRPATFHDGMAIANYGPPQILQYSPPVQIPVYHGFAAPPTPVEHSFHAPPPQFPPPPVLPQHPFYHPSSAPPVGSYPENNAQFEHYIKQQDAARWQQQGRGGAGEPSFVETYAEQHYPLTRRTSHSSGQGPIIKTDRDLMPPPPRPPIKKTSSEQEFVPQRRRSVHHADDERPKLQAKRLSMNGPPPSAYRAPGEGRPRYEMSYSDGPGTIHVASSTRPETLYRHETAPPSTGRVSLDQQLRATEEYMERSNGDLTTEKLSRHMKSKQASLASDAGHSHQSTRSRHRTPSETSNGGKTTINTGHGVSFSFDPELMTEELALQIGSLNITMNKPNKEQRRIEGGTSNSSKASVNVQGQPLARKSSNTSSIRAPVQLSQKHSRTSSRSRNSFDHPRDAPVRTRGHDDYSDPF